MFASFPVIAAWANAVVFASAGLVNVTALRAVREVYARWDIPGAFYRALGIVEIIAAALLGMPHLRVFGIAMAAPIMRVHRGAISSPLSVRSAGSPHHGSSRPGNARDAAISFRRPLCIDTAFTGIVLNRDEGAIHKRSLDRKCSRISTPLSHRD